MGTVLVDLIEDMHGEISSAVSFYFMLDANYSFTYNNPEECGKISMLI